MAAFRIELACLGTQTLVSPARMLNGSCHLSSLRYETGHATRANLVGTVISNWAMTTLLRRAEGQEDN